MAVEAPERQLPDVGASRRRPAPPTGVGRRLLAHLIDLLAVLALGAAAYVPTASSLLAGVVAAEAALGLAFWEARTGRTLGKSLLGIRVAQTGRPFAPGLRREAIRAGVLGLGHLVAMVGQFVLIASAALDRTGRGQGWHDRLAGTTVLDVREGAATAASRRPRGDERYAPRPDGSGGPARAPAPAQHAQHAQQGGSAANQHPVAPGQPPVPQWQGQPSPAQPSQPWQGQPGPSPQWQGQPQPSPQWQGPPARPTAQPPTAQPPTAQPPTAQPPTAQPPTAHQMAQPPVHAADRTSAPSGLPEHTFQPPVAQRQAPRPTDQEVAAPAVTPAPAEQRPDRAAVQQPETVFVLTLDDGRTVTVTGPGLLGRRPQVPAGERYDHLVAIDDPGRSLSRTHARFGIDGGGLWVEDRGSANGTVVVSADGTETRAFPGKRVTVPPDGRIQLGERTVTVQEWQS